MGDKKTVIARIPIELQQRIDMYGKNLEGRGLTMSKTDLMRNFAQNAITPTESVADALKRMNNASKKRF